MLIILKIKDRLKYEANRYWQKIQYYIRKILRVDIQKQFERKLFQDCLTKQQVLDKLSSAVLTHDFDACLELHTFDSKFLDNLQEVSDKVIRGELYLLFDYRKIKINTPVHIDWYTDFASGYRYSNSHTYDCRKRNNKPGVEIKNVWELSRLQFLIAPALLWRITGKTKYAIFVKDIMLDWIRSNHFEEGPNWNVSMEIGIRLYNMTLATELISNCDEILPEDLVTIVSSLYLQARYIMKNQENYRKKTYNHFLGGLIGTLAVGALFRKDKVGSKIFEYSIQSFEKEIHRQILDDGGSFEGTTCYHGLVGEIFALAYLLSENCGYQLSPKYQERLWKAADFSMRLSGGKNTIQIGDNDSGRVLCFFPGDPLDYSLFRNLVICGLQKGVSEKYADIIMMIGGKACENLVEENSFFPLSNGMVLYKDDGISSYRKDGLECFLYSVEAQKYGMGGHTHNDKGAIVVRYNGIEIVTDPGTGCYTPIPLVNMRQRSVMSHSTVSVNCSEQNEKQAACVLGNSYDSHGTVDVTDSMAVSTVHVKNSYVEYTHKRILDFSNDKEIWIRDSVVSNCLESIDIRFILNPKAQYVLNRDGAEITIGDITFSIVCTGKHFLVEKGWYSPSYGKYDETSIICIHNLPSKTQKYEIETKICIIKEKKHG